MSRLTAAGSRRGKWLVAASWVLLVVVGSVAASHFQGAQNNDQSSYLPGNAESSKVMAQVKRIQGGHVVTPAAVVFARKGRLRPSDLALISADARRLDAELPRSGVPARAPVRSRDGHAALLIFGLRLHGSTSALESAVGKIRQVVHRHVPRGLQVAVTGPAGSSYDAQQTFNQVGGSLLTVTVALIFVLLLVIYRSPIFWLIPLLSVGAAEVCAEGLGYLLTRAGVTVNAEGAGILTVLVFGAGTDYALLLVSRYREELGHHRDHHDALRAALRRGGPVVVASATTVILALLCLLAAEVDGTRGLGPVTAIGVAVTLISALTLLPALLAIGGRRIFWPFVPRFAESTHPSPAEHRASGWRAIAGGVARRHRLIAVLTTLALAIPCLGLLGLNGGLTSGNSFRGRVESVSGQRLIAAHYPAGTSEPVQVIVPAGRPLRRVIAAVGRAAEVRPEAVSVQRHRRESLVQVTLAANPSSAAAFRAIAPIRAAAHRVGGPGTLVGGATAQEVDLRSAATRDTAVVAPMILLVVFVVLGLLLRSLVAPALLIPTVVLSFGAALGTSVLAFNHLFGYPGEDPSMPLFAFLFLVAIGIDYNIFLMARVREEALADGTRPGVMRALVSTGPVITSAGIVLAGTFAALASLPLIGFTELGFVIAFGVLLDTLLVRTVLVPALALELGRRIWWPSSLARGAPHLLDRGRIAQHTPATPALQHSHAVGPTDVSLLEETIGERLERAATEHASLEALVSRHQGLRYTYAELDEAVDEVARALLALGLERGDRLGIWSPNCAEWVLVQLATARIGVILVTINPAYRTAELEYALRQSGCRVLVAAREFKGSDYVAMIEEVAPSLPGLERTIFLGSGDWDELLAGAANVGPAAIRERAAGLDRHDPINIQYTSGTTGRPKGATLSHRNILNNGYFVGRAQGFTAGDRVCIPVPFYHCFGMVLGNLACLTHGACMVLPVEAFEPGAVLETVEAERCTALYGVPTMFIAELEHPDFERRDLGSLRTGIMAGAPCPIEVMRRVIDRMGMADVTIAYGMTETSPVSTQTGPDDDLEHRVGTVGQVQPHVEIKIVGPDGETVPCGEPGEFCTRGYSVMKGYWEDPERTAEAIDAEGWMHTGDLATLDADGYARIVGRTKDMVIRGGENVYPREVEEFLYSHPAVSDVQVIGVPDERVGEELMAWVVLKPGAELEAEELREFCRGRIAHFKVPRYVRFVDGFPMTVTGKVQKFKMREQAIAELGLAVAETA